MNDSDLRQLEATKERLIAGMRRYMNAKADCSYTEADIKKCDNILHTFIDSLQNIGPMADEPQILECIKRAVLTLNKLNDDAGGELIETDQREYLCEYILFASQQSGLKSHDDVTEEWRQW